MPGKNFRRLNEQSCLDCTHNKRLLAPDRGCVCDIDGGLITDTLGGRSYMPHEFICDEFEQVDWEAKKQTVVCPNGVKLIKRSSCKLKKNRGKTE